MQDHQAQADSENASAKDRSPSPAIADSRNDANDAKDAKDDPDDQNDANKEAADQKGGTAEDPSDHQAVQEGHHPAGSAAESKDEGEGEKGQPAAADATASDHRATTPAGAEPTTADTASEAPSDGTPAAGEPGDGPVEDQAQPPTKQGDGPAGRQPHEHTTFNSVADRILRQLNIHAHNVYLGPEVGADASLERYLKKMLGRPRHLLGFDLEYSPFDAFPSHEDSLLFVTCHFHDVALAAAYSLIDARYEGHAGHYLDLSDDEDCSIEVLERSSAPITESRIILVELTRETNFLRSLKTAGTTKVHNIKEILRESSTTVICVSTNRQLDEDYDETVLSKEEIWRWEISFQRFVLAQEFAPEEALELNKLIEQQRRQGRWPQDTADLNDMIRIYWKSGVDTLREQIELRRTEEGIKNLQQVRIEEIFSADRHVDQLAICIAVYFRDLTPQDFDTMLVKVLEDETLDESEKIVKPDDWVAIANSKYSKKPVEQWRDAPDAILDRCHLIEIRAGDGSRAIDFSQPYLRAQLREYIERKFPFVMSEFFERIKRNSLLFDPNLSTELTRNVVRIVVSRIRHEPDHRVEMWLLDAVFGIRYYLREATDSLSDEADLIQVLALIHSSDEIWSSFLRRLSDVIREMLRYQSLVPVVDRFLQQLLGGHDHDHDAVLDIVIHVARNLRFVKGFDSLRWLHRLLKEGKEPVRNRTFLVLFKLASVSGGRIYEVLEGIYQWLPEKDRDPKRYNISHMLALQFIMFFSTKMASNYDEDDHGTWPSKYILFEPFARDPTAIPAKIDMLIRWLFHPGQFLILDHGFDDANIRDVTATHYQDIADLIEMWAWILEGATTPHDAGRNAGRDAVGVLDCILRCLCRYADRQALRSIQSRWHQQRQHLLRALNAPPVHHRAERARLAARRLKVAELSSRIESIARTLPSTRPAGFSSEVSQ